MAWRPIRESGSVRKRCFALRAVSSGPKGPQEAKTGSWARARQSATPSRYTVGVGGCITGFVGHGKVSTSKKPTPTRVNM